MKTHLSQLSCAIVVLVDPVSIEQAVLNPTPVLWPCFGTVTHAALMHEELQAVFRALHKSGAVLRNYTHRRLGHGHYLVTLKFRK